MSEQHGPTESEPDAPKLAATSEAPPGVEPAGRSDRHPRGVPIPDGVSELNTPGAAIFLTEAQEIKRLLERQLIISTAINVLVGVGVSILLYWYLENK